MIRKFLVFVFSVFIAHQGFSQSKETTLFMRKELVKQRGDLLNKVQQIQKRIDSIDRKLKNSTNTQYLTKSVNYDSNTQYYNSLENNTTKKKRSGSRSTRTYHRGPRGGCYYINSNGNKTYVARSMCN